MSSNMWVAQVLTQEEEQMNSPIPDQHQYSINKYHLRNYLNPKMLSASILD